VAAVFPDQPVLAIDLKGGATARLIPYFGNREICAMGAMERLTIELPAHLVEGLRNSVKSGEFASESAAIEALLRSWYGDEVMDELDIDTLRAIVGEGIADVEAGRVSDAEDVYARIRARIEAIAASKSK
jgi:antitoxin ParD1/3/4